MMVLAVEGNGGGEFTLEHLRYSFISIFRFVVQADQAENL